MIHTVIQHHNYILADFRQNNAWQISLILSSFVLTYCYCEFVTSLHFLCHKSGLTDTLTLKFSRKYAVLTESSLWFKSCCKKEITLNRSNFSYFNDFIPSDFQVFKFFQVYFSSFSVCRVNQIAKLTFDVQGQWLIGQYVVIVNYLSTEKLRNGIIPKHDGLKWSFCKSNTAYYAYFIHASLYNEFYIDTWTL